MDPYAVRGHRSATSTPFGRSAQSRLEDNAGSRICYTEFQNKRHILFYIILLNNFLPKKILKKKKNTKKVL